jgi:hypothetical protein
MFVTKCELGDFVANNEYSWWLRSQKELNHRLGNTRYDEKQRQWQHENEILAQQGVENPYDKFRGLTPFMHAHSKLTESSDVSFYSQSTSEVTQKALRGSSQDSNEGDKENDALTNALGNRSNEVVFVVISVSWPRMRVFQNTNLATESGKRPRRQRL